MESGKIYQVPTDVTFYKKDAPQILFKYQAINEYNIANLENGMLWAALPSSFNDPFEYKHKVMGQPGSTEWDDLYKKKDSITIICLTEVPDDLLMWAHYANSHSGFCMGFEVSKLTTKVNYSNDYPSIDFTKTKNEQILAWHKILHSKSEHWNYEREHRMIFGGPASLRDYPGKLTTIIFGLRTKEADKQKIKGILKKTVNYYQAAIDDSSYKINIYEEQINIKLANKSKSFLSKIYKKVKKTIRRLKILI